VPVAVLKPKLGSLQPSTSWGNQAAAETTIRRDQIDRGAEITRLTASSANP
jgi:hypothetical protein